MKTLSVFLLCISLNAASHSRSAEADINTDIASQVKAARAILDPWHSDEPESGDRKLHIVYWSPSDRKPAPNYRERLTRILLHIQSYYADEMERLGLGRRSIALDLDADKMLIVHKAQGKKPYSEYNVQSGQEVRADCIPVLKKAGIDPQRETIVIFCNLAEWDDKKKTFRHRSPYYAGGSAKGGTAWQLDSEELDTKNLPLKEPMIQDGQYGRISLGKHNSIFIGGIAHELGHALGLPHNKERPDERPHSEPPSWVRETGLTATSFEVRERVRS